MTHVHVHVFQEWDILREQNKDLESKNEKVTSIMNKERPSFGFLIQQARMKKRMTTMDVAEAVYLNPKFISMYENGTEIPSAEVTNNLKKILDIV